METESQDKLQSQSLLNQNSRYMLDLRKHYLLASNTDSLESLLENQKEDLTKFLIQLKSEYDLIIRESMLKKKLIEEYDKKINMLQKANTAKEKIQEEKKETVKNIKEGIELKKNKKSEEEYNKKTLTKQLEKLSKDLLIIQKNTVQCENEIALLDKKKERTKLEENAIKEEKNKIQYKIDLERKKIRRNRSENDLQIQYYETVIRQKELFMKFADDRKIRQKRIEQDAKIDSNDKQEVDKRKKLLLLQLYNQYLKKRFENQLNNNEEYEYIFQQIRDIVGTQDLDVIMNFILQSGKRYNYHVQMVEEKQNKIDKLKKEIKRLNTYLINLKNVVSVDNLNSNLNKEKDILDINGLNQKEIDMIKKENEKNEQLRILGQKYNEVNLAYNQILINIKKMKEFDTNNHLDIGEENNKEQKEEEKDIKKNNNEKIQLTKEEEENINVYENLLNKILKAFNILYLCKSKNEFINLMREKGINQQNYEYNKIQPNKKTKSKKRARRSTLRFTHRKSIDDNEIKKNLEDESEEYDPSSYDPDKKILNKFLKEQKKEVDEFVKIKKLELRKPPADK